MTSTACVTGGAQGIGLAISRELASRGFRVAVVDVCDDERGAAVCGELPGAGHLFIRADISIARDREQIVSRLQDVFPWLDMLVNNAGVAPLQRTDILETTEESYDRVMGINLKATFFLTQALSRWMIRTTEQQAERRPKIVNISSISSYTSSPSRPEYCISKAGVSMVTKLFADRLARHGILVFEIRPGIIRTGMTAAVQEKYDDLILRQGLLPLARWGEPADVAAVVGAIASGAFDYSTGQVFDVDGGFHLRRL